MTKKAPYKGLGADSEEKREPVSDIDTAVVDSLKALDPNRPIREADIHCGSWNVRYVPILLQKSAIEERGIFRDFLRPFVATCSI